MAELKAETNFGIDDKVIWIPIIGVEIPAIIAGVNIMKGHQVFYDIGVHHSDEFDATVYTGVPSLFIKNR